MFTNMSPDAFILLRYIETPVLGKEGVNRPKKMKK